MPPGPRPPRQEDESYNAYGSKRMQGKFQGTNKKRPRPQPPEKSFQQKDYGAEGRAYQRNQMAEAAKRRLARDKRPMPASGGRRVR